MKDIGLRFLMRFLPNRHKSGEGYGKISAALKVPMSTVASITRKWKKFGTTRTLPRAGWPSKLSDRGEKGLGQGGDQEPNGHSVRAPAFLRGEREENRAEGQTSLQQSTNQACMAEWPGESHSLVKGTRQSVWNLPKGT
ncbi:hypothetical protein NFI96_025371 [Prochilodus magdalenae]|nr:hypothetical protein NFI96_025371 [Prochilodus magdalenae]